MPSVCSKTNLVEWRVTKGPNRGAEVNIDYKHQPSKSEGQVSPDAPHIGWQTAGKPNKSGHIIVDQVPAGRVKK